MNRDCKRRGLSTVTELHNGELGHPSSNHSFIQDAADETVHSLFLKFGSKFLDNKDESGLRDAHPLIDHLAKMIDG